MATLYYYTIAAAAIHILEHTPSLVDASLLEIFFLAQRIQSTTMILEPQMGHSSPITPFRSPL